MGSAVASRPPLPFLLFRMSRDADERPEASESPPLPAPPIDGAEEGDDLSHDLEETFEAALTSAKFTAPPADLRDRILSFARGASFSFIGEREGIWLPTPDAPVAHKELYRDSHDQLATRLIRVRRGERVPPPPFPGERNVFLVKGTLASVEWTVECREGSVVFGVTSDAEATAERDALLLEWTRAHGAHEPETRPAPRIVPNDSRGWFPYAPGIEVSPFAHEKGGDTLVALRLTKGATLDDHEHDGVEELFVLSGSCEVEGRPMATGDYHRANAGSHHAMTRSDDAGCVLLVSLRPIAPADSRT